jgi:riboflavin biosynthesis pyrimidine reductase
MRLSEVRPALGHPFDISTDHGYARLRDIYAPPGRRYLRLNMITTLTGSASGADGTSETLSSRVDRKILGVIRAHADGILVGAETVRAEGYVVPRAGVLVVLTTTGDIIGHRMHDAADRVILVCPGDRVHEVRARAELPGATVLGVGDSGRPAPAAVRAALDERGLSRIVCEGGPSVASAFASAGMIDEFCVTVAPALTAVAEPFLTVSSAEPIETDVAGMLVDEAAFSYLRLRPR